jgi:hypothetical protein
MSRPLPLTRTACLLDYPDCTSVAIWQQCLALDAYQRWGGPPAQGTDRVCCYNWGAAHFRAPGRSLDYHDYQDQGDLALPCAALFALSVLDRVGAPIRFLRQQAARVIPGGLLVCTFAAWDAVGEDCAVGHALRRRIYDWGAWRRLLSDATLIGLRPFGGVDLRYHGHALGDHTLATLVMTKRSS